MPTTVKEEPDATNPIAKTVDDLFSHYETLINEPAWKDYAWHRIRKMAMECPELYGEFPAVLWTA